jgi:hypothetical protein
MAPSRNGRTYRVRQLPSYMEIYLLPNFLVELSPDLGPVEISKCSHSHLALALGTYSRPRLQLSCSRRCLPHLIMIEGNGWSLLMLASINKIYWLTCTSWDLLDSMRWILIFIFWSKCVASSSKRQWSYKYLSQSCIAITGLGSHLFGSWKQRGHNSFMWLRERLPKDLSCTRILIFGYDTTLVMSESFQTIVDIALSFISSLKSIGRSSPSSKPCVFLVHSLGGIVLKQAMVQMAGSGESSRFMLGSVKEVILFGVPNRGMQVSHLLPMVQGQPNENLIRLLSLGSGYLTQLDGQFSGVAIHRNIRLVSVYETLKTRTLLVILFILQHDERSS